MNNINLVNIEQPKIDFSGVISSIKDILSSHKDGNETLAILLHKEVSDNLAVLREADEDCDTYEDMFKYIAKKLSTKKLDASFKYKKGVGAKYLLEYKKAKSKNNDSNGVKDGNIELLNAMENVSNNVKKFKRKARDSDYFKKKRSMPQSKIDTLENQFTLLKEFLEEIV